MNDCLFCKIVRGELPSTRVYEDADFVAFLDIYPVSVGHTLIVPKVHAAHMLDASPEVLAGILPVAQKIAQAALRATDAQGFNLHVNNGRISGQIVDHLHVHVIPRFADDGLKHWRKISYVTGQMELVAQAMRKTLN